MVAKLTGRALDAKVAERCFGLRNVRQLGNLGSWVYDDMQSGRKEVIAFYRENMAAAWQVAEWIREHTGIFSLTWSAFILQWQCICGEDEDGEPLWDCHPEPAEAICRAALMLAERIEREASDA